MKKIDRVIEILAKEYGEFKTALEYSNIFQLLIAVILSAQCTDERVNKVTKKLFKELESPKDFAEVSQDKLEKLIFSTGFYKNKAKNIIAASKAIYKLGAVPQTMDGLTKLAGVGRKTANVVLSEGLNRVEGVVVDTHIFRVSKRLGLAKSNNAVSVERELMKKLDKKHWKLYGDLTIMHGRQICKSRKPNCDKCPLQNICTFSLSA